MRSWPVVLIFLALLGGVYFAMSGAAPDQAELPEAPGKDLVAEAQPADPVRTDRTPTGDPVTENIAPGRQEVIVTAHDSATQRPLAGFVVTLSRSGEARPPTRVESERHAFRLAPGDYVLDAEKAGWKAPGTATFVVSTDPQPEPVTIRLPFTRAALQLELEVRDATTRQPLTSFRATVRRWAPGATQPVTEFLADQRSQPLQITGAPDHRVAIQIEAEGYRPGEPVERTFSPASPVVAEQVFLVRQMKFTGIELRVRDSIQRPIPRLDVLAHRVSEGGKPKFLWNRTAAATDGNYRLPDLGPGKYRFIVTSVDAEDNPTMHVSHTEVIEYRDGQHIITPITLPAGAMIELHVTDTAGGPLGADVWIETLHPDGKARECIWQPLIDGKPDHHAGLGADKLVKSAPARLHRCLPPGRYTLRLRRGAGEVVERAVDLVAGRKSDVRVQLLR